MNSLKDFSNYRVAVFTMDDMVFNLNQVRYDFSQLLYPSIFKNMTYHEYALRLGTVHSMYGFLEEEQAQTINEKIESYLYNEKNLRNIKVNENIEAVFNLLKSKGIKIVLFTTHSSKRAKQLLKYKNLLSQIDQVVSISEFSDDTPSIKLFHTIIDLYQTNHYELLIVSSLNSIFKCVRYSPIDTVYIQISQLTCIEPALKPTVMMSNLFELLQYILFGKYTSTNLYNDFLGYDDDMTEEEKRSRYEYLKIKYNGSPDIMPIVEEVFSEKNEVQFGDFNTQEFRFHFTELSNKKEEPALKQEDFITQPTQTSDNFIPQKKDEQSYEVFDDPDTKEFEFNFDETLKQANPETSSIQLMDPHVSELLSDINHEVSNDNFSNSNIQSNQNDDFIEPATSKIQWIINFLGSLVICFINSFLLVSIVGLLYMAFESWINQQWIIKATADMFIVGYAKLCLFIVDAIPFLPNSSNLISGTTPLFNQFITIVLFTTFLFGCYSFIRHFTEEHN